MLQSQHLTGSQYCGDNTTAVQLPLAALGAVLQVLCEDVHMLQTYSIKLLRMLLCHRCFLRTCTQGTHNKLCCCWLCFLVGMPLVQKVYSKASHVLIDIHTARNFNGMFSDETQCDANQHWSQQN